MGGGCQALKGCNLALRQPVATPTSAPNPRLPATISDAAYMRYMLPYLWHLIYGITPSYMSCSIIPQCYVYGPSSPLPLRVHLITIPNSTTPINIVFITCSLCVLGCVHGASVPYMAQTYHNFTTYPALLLTFHNLPDKALMSAPSLAITVSTDTHPLLPLYLPCYLCYLTQLPMPPDITPLLLLYWYLTNPSLLSPPLTIVPKHWRRFLLAIIFKSPHYHVLLK